MKWNNNVHDQIKLIQNESKNLEKQINDYSQIIKKKEEEEKEKEKKGIFKSCVDINKEDFEEEKKGESEEKDKENKSGEKKEKDDDDDWEEIDLKDVESLNEELDVDIDADCDEFEIIETYVDNETSKNASK